MILFVLIRFSIIYQNSHSKCIRCYLVAVVLGGSWTDGTGTKVAELKWQVWPTESELKTFEAYILDTPTVKLRRISVRGELIYSNPVSTDVWMIWNIFAYNIVAYCLHADEQIAHNSLPTSSNHQKSVSSPSSTRFNDNAHQRSSAIRYSIPPISSPSPRPLRCRHHRLAQARTVRQERINDVDDSLRARLELLHKAAGDELVVLRRVAGQEAHQHAEDHVS